MVLQQQQVQDILGERTILKTSYTWFTDYEGVVNIRTTRPARKAATN